MTLREISAETVLPVLKLAAAEHQQGFVEPNAVSLAQAPFSSEVWFRAICAGAERVGFFMLAGVSLTTPASQQPDVGVWHFMIDAEHQGKDFGRAAMLQVIEHVRSKTLCQKPAPISAWDCQSGAVLPFPRIPAKRASGRRRQRP